MHISHFTINKYVSDRLGLSQLVMRDLGDIVVLTGENGCGKSRLLSAVDWMLRYTQQIGYGRLLGARAEGKRRSSFTKALLEEADSHYSVAGSASDEEVMNIILEPLKDFDPHFSEGENIEGSLAFYVNVSDSLARAPKNGLGHFSRLALGVPRGVSLSDSLLIDSPLIYINDVWQRRKNYALDKYHMGFYTPDPDIERSYSSLQEIISEVAGMTLASDREYLSLNGVRVSEATYSEGQIILLRMAVLLHSKLLNGMTVPILLDEPERHLHPSRVVKMIERLRWYLPGIQLWIATHSLALTAYISSLEPRAIWFGSAGNFQRAGKAPESVVNGLLGGADGAERISDFCTRSADFAANAFSAECLIPPRAVVYKSGDEQVEQIFKFVNASCSRTLVIVDIGAGKGRLLDGLSEALGGAISSYVSYFAIDTDAQYRAECAKKVGKYFSDSAIRVFPSARAFIQAVGDGADVVVMANVLHEVPIENWQSLFVDAALVLSESGSLLIVEDTRLPRGELANINGYLVLEAEALCELFFTELGGAGVECVQSRRAGSRLQATAFTKQCLERFSRSGIENAVRAQSRASARKIRELRHCAAGADYSAGREHAYHTQLLANLALALEDLEN